jgi:hypothetical protein
MYELLICDMTRRDLYSAPKMICGLFFFICASIRNLEAQSGVQTAQLAVDVMCGTKGINANCHDLCC